MALFLERRTITKEHSKTIETEMGGGEAGLTATEMKIKGTQKKSDAHDAGHAATSALPVNKNKLAKE